MAVDALQQTVLDECAASADMHPCVKAIYIFGSVARGDYGPPSDVDIFIDVILDSHKMVEDFTQLHGEAEGFGIILGAQVQRPVHVHGMKAGVQTDEAWPAIQAASDAPMATVRKAILVPTPKKTTLDRG